MFSSKSRSDKTLVAVKTLNGQCFSYFLLNVMLYCV